MNDATTSVESIALTPAQAVRLEAARLAVLAGTPADQLAGNAAALAAWILDDAPAKAKAEATLTLKIRVDARLAIETGEETPLNCTAAALRRRGLIRGCPGTRSDNAPDRLTLDQRLQLALALIAQRVYPDTKSGYFDRAVRVIESGAEASSAPQDTPDTKPANRPDPGCVPSLIPTC